MRTNLNVAHHNNNYKTEKGSDTKQCHVNKNESWMNK